MRAALAGRRATASPRGRRGKGNRMKRKFVIRALLAGSALIFSAGRRGAGRRRRRRSRPSRISPTRRPTRPSPRRRPVDDAQAKIELLQAQVEALQESIEQLKTAAGQGRAVVEGRAAVGGQGRRLVSFKPRGRIQYDAGYVSNPDDEPNVRPRPATSASTRAPAASASARKARSRAASATSSRWTSPTAPSVSATSS